MAAARPKIGSMDFGRAMKELRTTQGYSPQELERLKEGIAKLATEPPQGPKPLPRCAVHGTMRYQAAGEWWVCHGWDGEGCCALEAEMLDEDRMVVEPAANSQPSQWGYRPAVPASVRVPLVPE